MTPKAIHWLLYDYLRAGKDNGEITEELEKRGASYQDLVDALIAGEHGETK